MSKKWYKHNTQELIDAGNITVFSKGTFFAFDIIGGQLEVVETTVKETPVLFTKEPLITLDRKIHYTERVTTHV